MIEGLATFHESALTGEGRLRSGDFLTIVDAPARGGQFGGTHAHGANWGFADGHVEFQNTPFSGMLRTTASGPGAFRDNARPFHD